jgi:NADPH:quinone reductase-like Zn-dependent oxidoreductase
MPVLRLLLEQSKIIPIVDRTFPLDRIVVAMDVVATGGTRGRIVIVL